MLKLPGKLITIDINDDCWRHTQETINVSQKILDKILFIKKSSVAPETYQKISNLVQGKKVMVILDSLHGEEHVEKELELYAPLIPVGGYILVNDTALGGPYLCLPWLVGSFEYKKIGPLYGVKAFLKKHPEFISDQSKERYSVSCMFSGILKRIQ